MFHNYDLSRPRTQIPLSHVQVLPKFFHSHEIEAIEKNAQDFPLYDAMVQGGEMNNNMVLRESQIKWLAWDDENWWIYSKIMQKAEELNRVFWQFDLFGINEYLQYTIYNSSQVSRGHYDWHLDVTHDGIGSNRKLSFECVLRDDYEGGEFSMLLGPSENRLRLGKGDAILYPSYLMNKIYPVRAGTRTSLVSWISGPSFK